MNSDDDDNDDDDILLSDVFIKKKGSHTATTKSQSMATTYQNKKHNMLLDHIFQETTNHYQAQARIQSMMMSSVPTTILDHNNNNNNNNTSVTPESITTKDHTNTNTTSQDITTITTSTSTNITNNSNNDNTSIPDLYHHHQSSSKNHTTPVPMDITSGITTTINSSNHTTHRMDIVPPTQRTDEALRDTIYQLTKSLSTHSKKRISTCSNNDNDEDNNIEDNNEEENKDNKDGINNNNNNKMHVHHEWHLFENKNHRHVLQRAYEDEMCRNSTLMSSSSSSIPLPLQRYIPMTRIRHHQQKHSPSTTGMDASSPPPIHPSSTSSPIRTKHSPKVRRPLRQPHPQPPSVQSTAKQQEIHFFSSYSEAMQFYYDEIVLPSKAIQQQQLQKTNGNHRNHNDSMNDMLRFYTQVIPTSIQYQMLHSIIPQYIQSLQQWYQSKTTPTPTTTSNNNHTIDMTTTTTITTTSTTNQTLILIDVDDDGNNNDITNTNQEEMWDDLQHIHQQFYDWLLGMACSIDVFIWVPPQSHPATTTKSTTNKSSIQERIESTCHSSIQFVLAIQKYQFDHLYWQNGSEIQQQPSTTTTVSIRHVWNQLSNDWFHNNHSMSTTKHPNNCTNSSNNNNHNDNDQTKTGTVHGNTTSGTDVVDSDETMTIVNVRGFMNYLLYCEKLIGYIVPSSATMNMDAGFHIIHTLLCCSLLYSNILPLQDIIRRIVYDLILLLLDPVVLESGSTARHSPSVGIVHTQHQQQHRYNIIKCIARVTFCGIQQLFMDVSSLRQQSHDDDYDNEDPNMWLSFPSAIGTFIPLTSITKSTRWDHSILYEFKAMLALRTIEELVFRGNGISGDDHDRKTYDGSKVFETTIEQLLTTSTATVTGDGDHAASTTTANRKSSNLPWSKLLHDSPSSIAWLVLGTAYCSLLQLVQSSDIKPKIKVEFTDTAQQMTQSTPQKQEQNVFDTNDTAKVLATLECVIILYQTGILLLQSSDDNSNSTLNDAKQPKNDANYHTSSSQQQPPISESTASSSTMSSPTHGIVQHGSKRVMTKTKTEYGPWKNIRYLHTYMELFDDTCMNLSKSLLAPKAIHPHYRRADLLMKYVHIDTIKVKERLLYLLDKYYYSYRKGSNSNNKSLLDRDNENKNDDDDNDEDTEDDWEEIEQKRKLVTPKQKQQTKIVSFFAPTATTESSSKKKAKTATGSDVHTNSNSNE